MTPNNNPPNLNDLLKEWLTENHWIRVSHGPMGGKAFDNIPRYQKSNVYLEINWDGTISLCITKFIDLSPSDPDFFKKLEEAIRN